MKIMTVLMRDGVSANFEIEDKEVKSTSAMIRNSPRSGEDYISFMSAKKDIMLKADKIQVVIFTDAPQKVGNA